MSTITLTIPEYAKKIKKTRQAVLRAIKKEERGRPKPHLLPNVIKHEKRGRDYFLEVAV